MSGRSSLLAAPTRYASATASPSSPVPRPAGTGWPQRSCGRGPGEAASQQDPGKDPDDRSRRRHRDNLRCSRHDEPMTVDWTHELLEQFDLQWNLAHGPSLETLTDEEYLWEPVPGCWSIRPTGPGGRGEIEQAWPDPEPAPGTTIACRLSHLAGGVFGPRAPHPFAAPSPPPQNAPPPPP